MSVLIAYTVTIEASADGQIWQAVHPAETVYVPDHDTAGTVAYDLAVDTAAGQTAADGALWRVRVWRGADADTGTPAEAEYVHDIRDRTEHTDPRSIERAREHQATRGPAPVRVTRGWSLDSLAAAMDDNTEQVTEREADDGPDRFMTSAEADAARIERDQAARDAYWTDGCGADVLAQDDRLRESDATPDAYMSGPRSAADQAAPVLDANGDPVTLPDGLTPDDGLRAYFAGKVPAKCGHYIAASEARAGFTRCERC